MTMPPPPDVSATEWIRIVASRLAQRRPDLCAEDVLAMAIAHFKCSRALPPELAASQFDDSIGRQQTPAGR